MFTRVSRSTNQKGFLYGRLCRPAVAFVPSTQCLTNARPAQSDPDIAGDGRRAEDDNRTDAVAQPDAQTVVAADAPRSRCRWAAAAVNASAFLTRLASADWTTLAATVPGPFYQSPVDPLTHKEAT